MKTMFALAPLLLALSFVSCTDQGPLPPLVPELPGRPVIIVPSFPHPTVPRDAADIESTWVSHDNLYVDVRFQGGGTVHDFLCYAPDGFMESYPVQSPLTLSHDAHGDRGPLTMRTRLTFSLLPLKRLYVQAYRPSYGSAETIVLRVSGPTGDSARIWLVGYVFAR